MSGYLAWQRSNRYFGAGDESAERYMASWPSEAGYELIETSYFGFCIPEENLNGEIYHWIHPHLGVASGGLFLFRGKQRSLMNVEFMDFRHFMPMPADISDCTYANGLSVKMIKPLEEFEIRYEHPASGMSLELNSRAIMPPAFRPNGGHLTQAVRNRGRLQLNGKSYEIGHYFSRDRSWRDPRSEKLMDIAPVGWYVGVFGDDCAFNITAFDSPELNPAIAARYPGLEDGKNYVWGYLWKDGKLLGVKSCSKLTTREADHVTQSEIWLEFVDENDETHEISGVITAQYPFSYWPNVRFFFGLARWTYRGRTGYGDAQEAIYDPFIRENLIT